jgi:hypothetical protein
MAKRKLTKLRIREVSSVDASANPGARVLIRKSKERPSDPTAATVGGPRHRKKPTRNLFEHQEAARAAARAAKEKPMSKTYRKMLRAFNKAARPPAPPPPLDTAKLARQVGKGLARGEPFETAATRALRKQLDVPTPPTASIDPVDVSSAYGRMMKAARETAAQTGETPVEVFARIYADPQNRDIVAADKRDHFLRATKSALPLPPSSGPGLRSDQMPGYRKPVHGDELTKQVNKLMKRDGLSFEAAATRALRGKAA